MAHSLRERNLDIQLLDISIILIYWLNISLVDHTLKRRNNIYCLCLKLLLIFTDDWFVQCLDLGRFDFSDNIINSNGIVISVLLMCYVNKIKLTKSVWNQILLIAVYGYSKMVRNCAPLFFCSVQGFNYVGLQVWKGIFQMSLTLSSSARRSR